MTTTIGIVNETTTLSSLEVQTMAGAVRRQLLEHYCSAWNVGLYDFDVGVFTSVDRLPADSFPIVMVDDGATPGALGWHSVVSGMVDVGEAIQMGLEPSTVLSHEVLEYAADPYLQRWATDPYNGWQWAVEVADAVENDSYLIDGVRVSNFVLPAFFNHYSPGPYDHMGLLSKPFSVLDGGYSVVKKTDGTTSHWPPGTMLRPHKSRANSRTARRGISCPS